MSNRLQAAATGVAQENSVSKLIPLLWEISNLKRIRAAQIENSFAEQLFRRAWLAAISDKAPLREIALKITAEAVVTAELGAINRAVLLDAGLSEIEIERVLEQSFDAATDFVDENLKSQLRSALNSELDFDDTQTPEFVELLSRQPRSGATKIGAPKLVFDRPENHAEHCLSVAVFAVLLAPVFAADIETVFLAALAHHFHNAYLPDAGFGGEERLGSLLPKVFQAFRAKCLAELPKKLREKIEKIFPLIESAETAEAKTFHAADVLDRVLQMRHHAEANQFTLKFALEDMELVHAGAVQQFHYEILRAAKIIS